ncbi:MAG: hypothetical protein HUJ92_00300, partial [Bacteroidales bacterium]|nr:hypothetical protein [Bacteroidales bacterium]
MNSLKGELYFRENSEIEFPDARFDLTLNPESRIYKGHFPDNPITPGVCLLQTAVELCEDVLGCSCRLIGCRNIKYVGLIQPSETPRISYNMKFEETEDKRYKVKITIS